MAVETCDMLENRLYFAGEWRQGRDAEIESRFSADMGLNRVVSGASVEDRLSAIAGAKEAQSTAGWCGLKPHERSPYCRPSPKASTPTVRASPIFKAATPARHCARRRRMAAKAAEKLMPVSLELAGKSPTIVFDDCDIDLAVAGILFGIFSSTGQSGLAGSRLFVQALVFDEFLERLVSATRMIRKPR